MSYRSFDANNNGDDDIDNNNVNNNAINFGTTISSRSTNRSDGDSLGHHHVSSASMPAAWAYENNDRNADNDSESFPLLRSNRQQQQQQQQQPEQEEGDDAFVIRRRISDPTHNNHRHRHRSSAVLFHQRDEHNNNWSGRSQATATATATADNDDMILTVDHHWFPDAYEHDDEIRYYYGDDYNGGGRQTATSRGQQRRPPPMRIRRSIKRRCFLFLTEFESSRGSAIFFVLLMASIFLMNVVMIIQTMPYWQYTPDDCVTCGGTTLYTFEDDESIFFEEQQEQQEEKQQILTDSTTSRSSPPPLIPCVCPPAPLEWTDTVLKYMIYFFTIEWVLRVVLFEPPPPQLPHPNSNDATTANNNHNINPNFWRLFLDHLTDTATILDALAIFPFYLESIENTNGLMSLRLLRLFRTFQLLRLGQYNTTFWSLSNVLKQSILYLRLLVLVLVFGACLFGSMMYYLEKGTWKYHEESGIYRFMRIGVDGTEEPSPFTSIPAAFWWFLVTATTVGYGDVYPTTFAGKFVAAGAMLSGVLVVAFPVSVFSDLWAKEVQRKIHHHHPPDDDDNHNIQNNNNNINYYHDDSGIGGPGSSPNPSPAGQEEGCTTTPVAVANSGGGDIDAPPQQHNHNNNSGDGFQRARDVENLWSSFRRLSSPVVVSQQVERNEKEVSARTQEKRKTVEGALGSLGNLMIQEEIDHQQDKEGDLKSTISFQREDLREIVNRLDTIRENETRIRSILKKYHQS